MQSCRKDKDLDVNNRRLKGENENNMNIYPMLDRGKCYLLLFANQVSAEIVYFVTSHFISYKRNICSHDKKSVETCAVGGIDSLAALYSADGAALCTACAERHTKAGHLNSVRGHGTGYYGRSD